MLRTTTATSKKPDPSIPALLGKGYHSPYARAKRAWDAELSPWTFEAARDVILLTGGYCFCTPAYFIMGKAIVKDDTARRLDIIYEHPADEVDCWHIWLMAGDISKCWDNYPFPLPFVSWEVTNHFRVYKMERVRQHLML